jgi:hypothetical protein
MMAIKIRMYKVCKLTPTTISNEESPDQSEPILDRLDIKKAKQHRVHTKSHRQQV